MNSKLCGGMFNSNTSGDLPLFICFGVLSYHDPFFLSTAGTITYVASSPIGRDCSHIGGERVQDKSPK